MRQLARVTLLLLVVHAVPSGVRAQSSEALCLALKAAGAPVTEGLEARQGDYADAFKSSTVSENWKKTLEAGPFRLGGAKPDSTGEMIMRMLQIRAAVDASDAFDGSPTARRLKSRLVEELARLFDALASVAERASFDWSQFEVQGGELSRFEMQAPAVAVKCDDGQTYNTNTMFFATGQIPQPVVLQAFLIDAEGNVAGEPIYFATARQAVVVRAATSAVVEVFSDRLAARFNMEAARLAKVNAGWNNYLSYGYSQYPWEAFVNSWGVTWDRAPKTQLVVLHPEAAAVIDLRGKHSSLDGSLLLHGLGLIGYVGETRKLFVGASATGAVTTSDALGFGGGGTLHFGYSALHARVPHISLALLGFATQTGKRGPFLGISIDLWRLVTDSGDAIFLKRAL